MFFIKLNLFILDGLKEDTKELVKTDLKMAGLMMKYLKTGF